jgi:hypothetical protein
LPEHLAAHRGMNPVGADDEVVAPHLAIAGTRHHLVVVLLDRLEGDAHAHRRMAGSSRQQSEELAPAGLADGAKAVSHHAEIVAIDHVALAVGEGVVVHRVARRHEVGEGAETVQDAAAERIEAQHVAGMLEIRRPIDQVRLHVPTRQQRGERKTADSGTDDEDAHASPPEHRKGRLGGCR